MFETGLVDSEDLAELGDKLWWLDVDEDYSQEFVDSRRAFENLQNAVFTQPLHSLRDGLLSDLVGRDSLEHQLADRFGDHHELEQTEATLVSGALAPVATLPAVEHDLFARLRRQAQAVQRLNPRRVGFCAMGAD